MRKIIALLPCLEGAGGIRVLIDLFQVIQKMGYQISVWSQLDGSFRQEFEKMGIGVKIQKNMLEETFVLHVKEDEDILVNTLQMFPFIKKINDMGVKNQVYWWIHEPPAYFKLYEEQISTDFFINLNGNTKVCAAGPLVQEYLWNKYQYHAEILNIGVKESYNKKNVASAPSKTRFLLPSFYFDYLKGQDLLIKSILKLPQGYLEKAEFYFLGIVQEDMMSLYHVIQKLEAVWGNVHYIPLLEHDELLMFMNEMDCIVAPSREDATNACVVEGLMLSKVCICSEQMGVSYYLKDGESAFIVAAGDVEALTNRIMQVINNKDGYEAMKKMGHHIYEMVYSEEVFAEKVKHIFA